MSCCVRQGQMVLRPGSVNPCLGLSVVRRARTRAPLVTAGRIKSDRPLSSPAASYAPFRSNGLRARSDQTRCGSTGSPSPASPFEFRLGIPLLFFAQGRHERPRSPTACSSRHRAQARARVRTADSRRRSSSWRSPVESPLPAVSQRLGRASRSRRFRTARLD